MLANQFKGIPARRFFPHLKIKKAKVRIIYSIDRENDPPAVLDSIKEQGKAEFETIPSPQYDTSLIGFPVFTDKELMEEPGMWDYRVCLYKK